VIAHEVGHLAAGHSARSGEMQRAGMQPFLLTMGLGVLAAFAGAGDAAVALMGSAGQFGALGAMGYSREQEGRADQAGLNLLNKAGISGRGLVEFFENFRYQEVFQEARRFAYFRSHPLSSDRIERLRARAEKLPDYDKPDSEALKAEHAVMKAKLLGFLSPQRAIVVYSETDTGYPARYARAIAYYQMKEPDRALKLIEALLEEQPQNPYLWELKGQILFEEGRPAEAVVAHREAVRLKPDAPLLRVNLAHALIETNDKANLDEAIDQLKHAVVAEKDNTMAWRLLAQAYASQGKEGEARLASAEYYFAGGDEKQATQFALRARSMLDPGSIEWRRAVDIVLASGATPDDLNDLDRRDAARRPATLN